MVVSGRGATYATGATGTAGCVVDRVSISAPDSIKIDDTAIGINNGTCGIILSKSINRNISLAAGEIWRGSGGGVGPAAEGIASDRIAVCSQRSISAVNNAGSISGGATIGAGWGISVIFYSVSIEVGGGHEGNVAGRHIEIVSGVGATRKESSITTDPTSTVATRFSGARNRNGRAIRD